MGSNFDDGIILGWTQATDLLTADSQSNIGTYDDYRLLGYGKTDSSGNILIGSILANPLTRPFGYTGSWNDGTQTIYATDGRVTKVV